MKISKEVKTGILVLLGIILFIFGFNYLKGQNLLSSSLTLYTTYSNVEGLVPSTPVTINGLNVGKVISIDFKGDGSGVLQVELSVDSNFKFSKNSKAELYETGLIGGKAIAILPAFDGAENTQRDDFLEGTVKPGLTALVNQRLTPLQEKIEVMMVDADSLLTNINDVFDEKTKVSLRQSVAGLNDVIQNFKNTSNSLNNLMAKNEEKLNSTLANVDNISSNLSKTTNQLANANLEQTIKRLETTIQNFNSISSSIKNGEGSIGKLLKDEGLYNNLEGASLQLEQLLEDMKLNPKRYVHFSLFGKRPKQYDADGNEIKSKD
ncbi:MAG: MlaD family protein [Algibacter sp.]|uniref:MlaD family protein n=1 Tax=Algibacter sp. TaxID=1872428 RepID=UPI0026385CA2|nr:MlaD family protein [Algibacter sp.]MDG1730079.1 MlaD family protein [Algibacter sp.]MDG2179821.1 MlaD family protein [Algibacter sp.]